GVVESVTVAWKGPSGAIPPAASARVITQAVDVARGIRTPGGIGLAVRRGESGHQHGEKAGFRPTPRRDVSCRGHGYFRFARGEGQGVRLIYCVSSVLLDL